MSPEEIDLSVDWDAILLLAGLSPNYIAALHRCSWPNPALTNLRPRALESVCDGLDEILRPVGYSRQRLLWTKGPAAAPTPRRRGDTSSDGRSRLARVFGLRPRRWHHHEPAGAQRRDGVPLAAEGTHSHRNLRQHRRQERRTPLISGRPLRLSEGERRRMFEFAGSLSYRDRETGWSVPVDFTVT